MIRTFQHDAVRPAATILLAFCGFVLFDVAGNVGPDVVGLNRGVLERAGFGERACRAAPDERPASEPSPIEKGRDALRDARFPWYDAANDDLRRLDLRSTSEVDARPDAVAAPVAVPTASDGSFLAALGELLRWLIYLTLGLLLIGLIIVLVRTFLTGEQRALTESDELLDDAGNDLARVENLPFTMARPRGDLLSEAERLYQEGDYSGAIVYLYSYMLVRLDKQQVIRLARGKTNRQYLREARQRPELAAILLNAMQPFEEVFFGHYELDRRRFEQCWSELDVFQRLTGSTTEAPA